MSENLHFPHINVIFIQLWQNCVEKAVISHQNYSSLVCCNVCPVAISDMTVYNDLITHNSFIIGSTVWKKLTFVSGNHLNMWVTFVVFTYNRMVKLKMASKRSGLAILMITICRGNWNASAHAGTFHMTCAVLYYEITEKNAFVLVELL